MRRTKDKVRQVKGTVLGAEGGYTLVELSIVLLLSLILAGLGFGAYLFAVRSYSRWESSVALENRMHLVLNQVANDLRSAELVEAPTDTTWTVHLSSGGVAHYCWCNEEVRRSGRRLTGDEKVDSFALVSAPDDEPLSAAPRGAQLLAPYDDIFVDSASSKATMLIRAVLMLRSHRNAIAGSVVVAARRSALWPRLEDVAKDE